MVTIFFRKHSRFLSLRSRHYVLALSSDHYLAMGERRQRWPPRLDSLFQAARASFASIGVLARFLQNFSNDSVPPNNVVNIVESANTISPARPPAGGIQSSILNSRFPASVKGCGRDMSIGCLARTRIDLVSSVVRA